MAFSIKCLREALENTKSIFGRPTINGYCRGSWTPSFYKSYASEIKLAISYKCLCAEHEYDILIAKLALVLL